MLDFFTMIAGYIKVSPNFNWYINTETYKVLILHINEILNQYNKTISKFNKNSKKYGLEIKHDLFNPSIIIKYKNAYKQLSIVFKNKEDCIFAECISINQQLELFHRINFAMDNISSILTIMKLWDGDIGQTENKIKLITNEINEKYDIIDSDYDLTHKLKAELMFLVSIHDRRILIKNQYDFNQNNKSSIYYSDLPIPIKKYTNINEIRKEEIKVILSNYSEQTIKLLNDETLLRKRKCAEQDDYMKILNNNREIRMYKRFKNDHKRQHHKFLKDTMWSLQLDNDFIKKKEPLTQSQFDDEMERFILDLSL